jgi:hypothetical protein
MANSLSASFEEIWAKEQQTVFYKKNVAMAIADTSFNATMMNRGDTLNRTKRSALTPYAYTRGTAMTATDVTDTNESLTVDKQYYVMIYVDDFDQIQDKYDIAMNYGKDAAEVLSAQVDADVLGEVFNATSTVDDGTIGGTAGNGITAATTNILKIFGAARKKLRLLNVTSNDLYAVISPDLEDILFQNDAARVTDLGDDAYKNGFIGKLNGFKLYESNNLAGSAVLAMATQPTANDTVVIEGVTFTFVSSIGTTAGNVLIGANVDATRVNLETLINAPATTTATGVALSTANAAVFAAKVTAVDSPSANTLTVKYKGVGTLTVSKTFTDGTDTWTAAKIKQHCLFGVVGNPVLVMQHKPDVVKKDVPDKLGKNIINAVLYGKKTFTDNATQMVNVEVRADTW